MDEILPFDNFKHKALEKYLKGESLNDLKDDVMAQAKKLIHDKKPVVNIKPEAGNIFNTMELCIKALQDQGDKVEQIKAMRKKVLKVRSYNKALEVFSEYCELIEED